MNILVSAASKYGATAEVAQAIGDVLDSRGLEVTVIPPEQVDAIEGYDAVVLGSAVYMGQWMKPGIELVQRAAPAMATRPVWLFSSGPVGDPPKPAEDSVDVSQTLKATQAEDHHVFAGKLVKKQLSFPERAMALVLRAQDGDFRDWDEIKAWATVIADALQA
jgi:menaquinone-dependent protoporphyrinogen oxidase